jgi:hypothetical protein
MRHCNDQGTVNDLRQYERECNKEAITARGWLISSRRDIMLDAVLAGEGLEARLGHATPRQFSACPYWLQRHYRRASSAMRQKSQTGS